MSRIFIPSKIHYPVSYTHLDVYKRQEVIPGIEISTNMKGEELDGVPDHYAGEIINMHILGYETDIQNEELRKAVEYTVSYTHLDVYKRQPYPLRGRTW